MTDLVSFLSTTSYPGRGILLGRSPDGEHAVITYFIMGRSENSRNRVFVKTGDGIRTQAFDPAKMADPSLIIYHPVRLWNGITIVTNGDQTDTIRDALQAGHCYRHALKTRTFEPDAPNYTPRISGVVRPDGAYSLSILKTLCGDPNTCCRFFFDYNAVKPGVGHFISTYTGDGSPLPSFQGEPIPMAVDENAPQSWADKTWNALNQDNKISLFVRFIHLKSGVFADVIYNKRQGGLLT